MAGRRNTKAKGNLLQRYAKAILLSLGYEVEVCRPKILWLGPKRPISIGEDFFGKIDLIAVHPTLPPRFVQVSVPSELSRKRKALVGWTPFGCSVEVWIWRGGYGRHFDIYRPVDDYRTPRDHCAPLGNGGKVRIRS